MKEFEPQAPCQEYLGFFDNIPVQKDTHEWEEVENNSVGQVLRCALCGKLSKSYNSPQVF